MRVDDFDFELPPDRIAQAAPVERGDSRLLRLGRHDGAVRHDRFGGLPALCEPGDLLVLNDTRVFPARIHGRKASGGAVEVLLLEPLAGDARWRALVRSSRAPRPGSVLTLAGGIVAQVQRMHGGEAELQLTTASGSVTAAVAAAGKMPLPPYIRRDPDGDDDEADRRRYQTVYARHTGAVAAPTAGLHFTRALLDELVGRGVDLGWLTLHVGLGTFQPVRAEQVADHVIHSERFELPAALAEQVTKTRAAGGRVVAVGTTVVRTLENCATEQRTVVAGAGSCSLFIYPGYRFRVVDAMVTNFHLPRSTLLMLVCAFAGRERVLNAYREAIREGYRFYSYGDAMWIG